MLEGFIHTFQKAIVDDLGRGVDHWLKDPAGRFGLNVMESIGPLLEMDQFEGVSKTIANYVTEKQGNNLDRVEVLKQVFQSLDGFEWTIEQLEAIQD